VRKTPSPELKRKLLSRLIPVAIVYLAVSGVGLYLLANEETLPGFACVLSGMVLAGGFHRWARGLPSPYGDG